jgi:murein DD-endopeptidase MepM/ murein hydrolase activator NlpD
MAEQPKSFPVLARFAAVALTLATLVAIAPWADAGPPPTKQQVANAQQKVRDLRRLVEDEQAQLAQLGQDVAAAADAFLQAQDELDQVTADLLRVQEHLAKARARYNEISARLDERAHDAYVSGPGSSLDFLLGSGSLADFSDRLEYIDALAQTDVDLGQQVQNTKKELADDEANLEDLRVKAQHAAQVKKEKERQLQDNLDAQQELLNRINGQLADARRYADKLSREYKKWLASQTGVTWANGLFKACPVGQPRAFGDGFGAPRYAGGYHLHAGVDIIAPLNTPIYAPFDGFAHTSYNTLGGNAVYVDHPGLGYVYNAHLDHYSPLSNGPVKAGDIIGYVGWTGDAVGGVYHDHFEWHPETIPTDWPKSAYGYSVIGDAVNPYPLLVDACL